MGAFMEAMKGYERPVGMAEAAAYLGISRGTLYAWVSAGRIKAHKLAPIEKSGRGAVSRFYISELEKWVKEQ